MTFFIHLKKILYFSEFLQFPPLHPNKNTIPSHTNIMQFYATFINASSILAFNKNEVKLHIAASCSISQKKTMHWNMLQFWKAEW